VVLDAGVFRAIFEAAVAAIKEKESVFTQYQTAMGALVDIYAVGLSHGGSIEIDLTPGADRQINSCEAQWIPPGRRVETALATRPEDKRGVLQVIFGGSRSICS